MRSATYRRRHRDGSRLVYAVLLLGFGGLMLMLSTGGLPALPMPGSQQPYSAEVLHSYALDDGTPVQSSSKRAVAASEASEAPPDKPSQATTSFKRQPAPLDAAPISDPRALGASVRSKSVNAASAPTTDATPFSVVIAGAGDRLGAIADELAARLQEKGYNASVGDLERGAAPNVGLLLKPGAGADIWFCDPGPALSASLAGSLTTALAGIPASDAIEPRTPLDCGGLQAAWPTTAMALVELPPNRLDDPASLNKAVAGLESAVGRYFTTNGKTIRSRTLLWPAQGAVTSFYSPSHPLGIDIGAWQGPINAATDGVVLFAGGNACCSYGIYVVVRSPGGIETIYAHLSKLAVAKGQQVKQGQRLGDVGCTGHCSGPHLHFEVIDNGRRVDPIAYLP